MINDNESKNESKQDPEICLFSPYSLPVSNLTVSSVRQDYMSEFQAT
jgi:hypothetical protein